MLLGQNKTSVAVMAARETNSYKVPVYQAGLTNNPEQIYIAKETHTALQRIDRRERTFLWYLFGLRTI